MLLLLLRVPPLKAPEISEEGQISVCAVGRSMTRPAPKVVTSSSTSFSDPLRE